MFSAAAPHRGMLGVGHQLVHPLGIIIREKLISLVRGGHLQQALAIVEALGQPLDLRGADLSGKCPLLGLDPLA